MLKLTKKADYGLIALRHLAVGERSVSASAKEIAESYGIPLPLLAKILQKLARAGFLTSVHGTNGGYRLARDAAVDRPIQAAFATPAALSRDSTKAGRSNWRLSGAAPGAKKRSAPASAATKRSRNSRPTS